MRIIPLNKGQYTVVDDEDYDRLMEWKWFLNVAGYARRWHSPTGKDVFMHRFILGIGSGEKIDHINRNKLDNQRHNLRPCTQRQNCGNRTKTISQTASQYKGVVWHKQTRKWQVQVAMKYIGIFESEVNAAKAYDAAASEYFGEFALLNFP